MGCSSEDFIRNFQYENNDYSYLKKSPYVPSMASRIEAEKRAKERAAEYFGKIEKEKRDAVESFLNETVDPKLFALDPNFLKNCDNIVKEKFDDQEYEGQMKDGKRHGKGIMRWTDGDVYQGEYKEGKMHGKGIYKFKSGKTYNGEWVNGNMEGKGIMRYTDGVYEGDWKNDKREGKGKFTWAEEDVRGNVYEGEWKNDSRNGKGKMKYVEQHCTYEGNWEEGRKQGKGKITWTYGGRTSRVYEGDFDYDCMHGQGKYTFNDDNGSYYEGEFKFNFFYGYGHLFNKEGDYVGDFKMNKREGKGIMIIKMKVRELMRVNGNMIKSMDMVF